jgi:hypothetical protein
MVVVFGGAMCCIAWKIKKAALQMFMDNDSDDESVVGRPTAAKKSALKRMALHKKPENPSEREARLEKARQAAIMKKEAQRLADDIRAGKNTPPGSLARGSSLDGGPRVERFEGPDEEVGDSEPWSTYSYAYEQTVEAERKKKAAEHEAWKAKALGDLAAAEASAQSDSAADDRATALGRERQQAMARDRAASFSALPPQAAPITTLSSGAEEAKDEDTQEKAALVDKKAAKKAAEAERRRAKRAAAEAEAAAWQAKRMGRMEQV